MTTLALAAFIFLALHVLPATPVRARMVAAVGESAYLGLFSLLSLVSIWWWVDAFNGTALDVVWWRYPDWWPWAKAVILLFAAVLMVAGLSSPNPTLPQAGKLLERPGVGAGIFAITRHPLMWAFGLWGLAHFMSQPNWRGFLFFGVFAITALGGSVLQEIRKAATYGASWERFASKTSFIPFLAVLQGRARLSLSEIGWWRIGAGVLLWALLLYLHPWLFRVAPLPALA